MRQPVSLKNLVASLSLVIAVFFTQGCVQDDLSVCGVNIRFTYTKNLEGIDLFAEEVSRIDVFVFDGKGVFVGRYFDEGDRLKNSNYSLALNLMEGVYTFVVWGNLLGDYEYTELISGKTAFADAMLSLIRENDIKEEHPGSLYFGMEKDMAIKPDLQTSQSFIIDMWRDTKSIRVVNKFLPYGGEEISDYDGYTCSITSRNADYKFDNSITGSARVQYMPESFVDSSVADSILLICDFVTLRQLKNGSTNSKLTLEYRFPDINYYSRKEYDLINDLLLPAYIDSDFDIRHDYEIELEHDLANGSINVTIGDWKREFYPVILGY